MSNNNQQHQQYASPHSLGGIRTKCVSLGAVTCIHICTNTHWSEQTLRNVITATDSSDGLTSHEGNAPHLLSSRDVEMMITVLLDADLAHDG